MSGPVDVFLRTEGRRPLPQRRSTTTATLHRRSVARDGTACVACDSGLLLAKKKVASVHRWPSDLTNKLELSFGVVSLQSILVRTFVSG